MGARIWTLAEKRYLAGESARKVAGDLGMTVYALRARARRKGWTKQALAEARTDEVIARVEALDKAAAALWRDADDDTEAPTPAETARRALTIAASLLCQGRTVEAAAAARVAETMSRAALRLEGDEDGPAEDDEAVLDAVRRKVLALTAPAAPVDEEVKP